jgi:delta14-sterol reductase
MLTYFLWEYLYFEKVHLYTYDFIAERVGFKLGFGCLTFYPYFYAVSLWATVDLPNPHLPVLATVCFCILYLFGWGLARGANMQKYYFKTQGSKSFLGIKPETISDEKQSLLVNGFWGLSRHINYLGEILEGCGIALAAGYAAVWWVWLYPLYYVGLLFTRQMDDDKICKDKYRELWDVYTKKVKYRIIPFLY